MPSSHTRSSSNPQALQAPKDKTKTLFLPSSSSLVASEPFSEPVDQAGVASQPAAFVNFFKSLFGAGVLTLPHAMLSVGLPLAISVFIVLGLTCTYTVFLLLEAKRMADLDIAERKLLRAWLEGEDQDEEHDEEQTFSLCPPSTTVRSTPSTPLLLPPLPSHKPLTQLLTYEDLVTHLLGPLFGKVIRWTIPILSTCFCTGYVICIINNVQAAAPGSFSREFLGLCLLPILVGLGQIKWLNDLAIISLLGAVIYMLGVVGYSFFYSMEQWAPIPNLMTNHWSKLVEFSGTAVYALEGIALVLPCERSMKDKSKALPMTTSCLVLYTFVVVSYSAMVVASGVMTEDCDIVTDCFEGTPAKVIRVALSLALVLSHPVTLYPATEICEVLLERKGWDGKGGGGGEDGDMMTKLLDHSEELSDEEGGGGTTCKESGYCACCSKAALITFALRTTLVSVTVISGAYIKSFADFSNFIGAVGLTFIGFIVPPFLYVWACWRRGKKGLMGVGIGNWGAMGLTFFFGMYNIFVTGGAAGLVLFKIER